MALAMMVIPCSVLRCRGALARSDTGGLQIFGSHETQPRNSIKRNRQMFRQGEALQARPNPSILPYRGGDVTLRDLCRSAEFDKHDQIRAAAVEPEGASNAEIGTRDDDFFAIER